MFFVAVVFFIYAQREFLQKIHSRKAWICLTFVNNMHQKNCVKANVAVIDLLLSTPDIGTLVVPFFCIVISETWTYFDGVWSKLMINVVRNGNCQHDSQFGITTLILLFGYLLGLKLYRWLRRKRLWVQGFPMTILSFSNSEYLSTRTCAVVDATVVFTIPPVVSGCFKVTIPPHFSRCKVNRSNPYKVNKKVLFLANFIGDALFNETKITTCFFI